MIIRISPGTSYAMCSVEQTNGDGRRKALKDAFREVFNDSKTYDFITNYQITNQYFLSRNILIVSMQYT